MRYINTHITPLVADYMALLEEAYNDIMAFIDRITDTESEMALYVAIAIAFVTPIIGSFLFMGIVLLK